MKFVGVKFDDVVRSIIAMIVVLGFFTLLFFMFSMEPKSKNSEIINILYGTLSVMVGSVMQYYLGSSSGSKEKTRLNGGK